MKQVIFILLASLASLASFARALVVDPECINNLCHVASGCEREHKFCLGTGNAYCGPFRLSLPYWKDAGSPGSDFKSCVFDYNCSVRTVVAYMTKYASDCNYDGKIDCSDFAAIHLAGGGSTCSQKWVFASNHYKKYLQLMSQRPRTRVSVYEPTGLESSVVPSEEEITNVADSTNYTFTGLASLRDARRISFPVRTTRTPHRRYTVIYWNGNRRRLPEITNILDAHPWIIETARRPASHDRPSFKPTVSRRVTYFTPTTPMTTPTTTTSTTTPPPPTPSTSSIYPITVTKKRRVRPRTTIRPLVVNHPAGRPSNRRPQATTQPMSPSTTTMAPTTSPVTTTTTTTTTTPAPPPRTTRVPSSPPVISVTERPTRSTTPQAWWMAATRRRYPTYTWFETTNPWSRDPPTTATRTHPPRTTTVATTFYTTSTTTERPSTIRTSSQPRTTIRPMTIATTTTTPVATVVTSPSTEHSTSRTYMTFEPHRTRPVTDSISTEASVAVSSTKKPVVNDSSLVVNELQASCMECICTGSSESCNFDQTFNCHKEDECGPYQIDYAYWYEAGYPNFKGNGDSDFHECVTDRTCADKTVRTYLDKNKMDCNADGIIDCIDYAAIHKAGPEACHKQWVYESKYWSSFSQCHGFDFFRKRKR